MNRYAIIYVLGFLFFFFFFVKFNEQTAEKVIYFDGKFLKIYLFLSCSVIPVDTGDVTDKHTHGYLLVGTNLSSS